MRKLIIAASLCALATPVAAQPTRGPIPADEVTRRLPPPAEIEAMGGAIARLADALMSVDVGPVRDALDPYRRPRGRETLGDIASRDDPYARERIHRSIGSTTAGMAAMMNSLTIMTPILRRSLEDAARQIDAAARAGAYPRYPERGYGRDRDRDFERDRDQDRDRDIDRDRDVDRDRED